MYSDPATFVWRNGEPRSYAKWSTGTWWHQVSRLYGPSNAVYLETNNTWKVTNSNVSLYGSVVCQINWFDKVNNLTTELEQKQFDCMALTEDLRSKITSLELEFSNHVAIVNNLNSLNVTTEQLLAEIRRLSQDLVAKGTMYDYRGLALVTAEVVLLLMVTVSLAMSFVLKTRVRKVSKGQTITRALPQSPMESDRPPSMAPDRPLSMESDRPPSMVSDRPLSMACSCHQYENLPVSCRY